MSPVRHIPGIGTARLTPEQDVLAQNILADPSLDPQAAAEEVAFLHALAAEFDAVPHVHDGEPDTWAREREQVRERQFGEQLNLAA